MQIYNYRFGNLFFWTHRERKRAKIPKKHMETYATIEPNEKKKFNSWTQERKERNNWTRERKKDRNEWKQYRGKPILDVQIVSVDIVSSVDANTSNSSNV